MENHYKNVFLIYGKLPKLYNSTEVGNESVNYTW